MLTSGILNPQINSLLSRVRHTNTLVIADRGFPYWPQIETIDISLVDDIPTVLEVLRAVRAGCVFGRVAMAQEFFDHNDQPTRSAFDAALEGLPLTRQPHEAFKRRVPNAIGLIRTGDTTQYANMVLESA
ncbi:D-ribose pyranase [Posidoniimonas polymericola]|uniref:D-ribose pyranase n=1 Tax=Posidoniimonas polymericola TaxID=2528002 RepID=A0A5C5YQE5_9BACT|nr:RbsD/FucU domain-containing protein [Posidoniimonas polymericola]TWT76980.1 D-ribose pyranase [Posidoniimonas polymericola]